jgi:hypothetical protein
MKVIERSPLGGDSGPKNVVDRATGLWQFGLSWDQDIQAQSTLIAGLGQVLDNSYTLISNVTLPGVPLPVPLVLIGQTGVRTLYVSAAKGIFRVKGDNLFKLDEKIRQYKPARPNLVKRTTLMSQAVIAFLKGKGYFLDETESVLFFAQPGAHIDVTDSPVRILQSDGVDRYAASLSGEKIVLDAIEIQHITEILSKLKPAMPKRGKNLTSLKPHSKMIGFGDFQIKVWQLIILFILATIMLIVVIVTAMIIVSTT